MSEESLIVWFVEQDSYCIQYFEVTTFAPKKEINQKLAEMIIWNWIMDHESKDMTIKAASISNDNPQQLCKKLLYLSNKGEIVDNHVLEQSRKDLAEFFGPTSKGSEFFVTHDTTSDKTMSFFFLGQSGKVESFWRKLDALPDQFGFCCNGGVATCQHKCKGDAKYHVDRLQVRRDDIPNEGSIPHK